MRGEFLIAAIVLCAAPLHAQMFGAQSAELGAATSQFMSRGPGAEAAAMAGSVVSEVHDPTALYWNPAGLSQAGGMISGEHLFLVGGASYDFIGLSVPSSLGTFGLGMVQLGRDNIVARSAIDDPGYNVSNTQSDYMAGFAHGLGEHWSAGLTANILDFNMAGYSDTGWGLDGGLQGRYGQDDFLGLQQVVWLMGADMKNMVEPQINLAGSGEYYPRELRLGGGISFQAASRPESSGIIEHDRVTLLFSLDRTAGDPNVYPSLGLAYSYLNILIFRMGFDGALSAGMGFRTEDGRFSLDYSMENDLFGLNNRFTLAYRFSEPKLSSREIYREVVDPDYAEVRSRALSLAHEEFASGTTLFNSQDFSKAERPLRLAALLDPDSKKMVLAYRRAKKAARVEAILARETDAVLNPAPGQEEQAYIQIAELLDLGAGKRPRLIEEIHKIAPRIPAGRYADLSARLWSEGSASAKRLIALGRFGEAENVAATLGVIADSSTAANVAELQREIRQDGLAVRQNFDATESAESGRPDLALVKAAFALLRAFPDDAASSARAKAALASFRERHELPIRERLYLGKLYDLAAINEALGVPGDAEQSLKYLGDILTEDPANQNAENLLDAMADEGLAKP